MDGWMDRRKEIHPCVLQDIGPLGPLPKKKKKKRKKKMLNSCLTRLIAGLEEMI